MGTRLSESARAPTHRRTTARPPLGVAGVRGRGPDPQSGNVKEGTACVQGADGPRVLARTRAFGTFVLGAQMPQRHAHCAKAWARSRRARCTHAFARWSTHPPLRAPMFKGVRREKSSHFLFVGQLVSWLSPPPPSRGCAGAMTRHRWRNRNGGLGGQFGSYVLPPPPPPRTHAHTQTPDFTVLGETPREALPAPAREGRHGAEAAPVRRGTTAQRGFGASS